MKKVLMTLCFAIVAAAAFAVVPATDQYVPAVAHSDGFGGAQWRADLWIYNPSATQAANVQVFLLLRQANPTPGSQSVTVQPGDTLYFKDVIGAGLFNQSNAAGGLHILSSIPVLVTAESYNANVVTSKGQGTSGGFFGGVPASLGVGAGETTSVIGLDQDGSADTGQFRSNLALVETTGGSNTVNFVLDRYDSNGNLVGSWACDGSNSACAPLGPWEVRQFDLVLQNFLPPTGSNQRIRVRVTSGSGALIAAGSRIDNTTGDPSTIDMWAFPRTGRFEGIVLDVATGTVVDGGLQLVIGGGALTNFQGVAGIPCGSDSFTLDFSPNTGINVPIGADGTLTTSVSIDYTDGVNTLFTTNWTLYGARAADGTWSGTLKSDTTGGVSVGGYNYGTCNALGVTRQWRAAWTGGNS
jgi:hypothetical protein